MSEFASPFFGVGVVSRAVVLEEVGDLGDEGILGIAVGEERGDGEEDLAESESGRPGLIEDVKTDGAIAINIAVVNFRYKVESRRFEGIVGRELDIQPEQTAGIRSPFRSDDSSRPVIEIVTNRTRSYVSRRIVVEILQFLLNSSQRHIAG